MAKITDPDLLIRSSAKSELGNDGNIWIDTATRTISMAEYGELSSDGVSIQAVYSYLKEEWKDDAELIKFPFAMVAITPEQFEFVDKWQLENATTVNLCRDGGFAVQDSAGYASSMFAGIITLGTIGGNDQVYYQQTDGGEAANIVLTGAVNQAVKVYSYGKGTDVSFVADGNKIQSTDTNLAAFSVGDKITVTGSSSNNGTFTVSSVTSATELVVSESLTDEDAGNTVELKTDYRRYFKIFVREQAKLYAQSAQADIGVNEFTYQAYRFPLANGADLKITHADDDIDGDGDGVADKAPYDDMDITYLEGKGFTTFADATTYEPNSVVQDSTGRWFITPGGGTSDTDPDGSDKVSDDTGITDWASYSGERQIGSDWYAYDIIIDADKSDDGNYPSAEEIYEFVEFSLRQNVDIDAGAGTVIGKTASSLLTFVGDTLVTSTGVFIDDFSETDINRLEFTDVSGTKRTYPFVAAGEINFNEYLVDDGGAVYRMFFTDANGNNFGDSDAIIVKNNDGDDIAGNITNSSVQFTFDYDGNTQGGRTAGTDAAVTVVGIGLSKAAYVKATGTIGRSNANVLSLTASLKISKSYNTDSTEYYGKVAA